MSQETNIFQIEVPKRALQCFKGHEPLQADTQYYTILTSGEDGNFQRLDFCLSCWEKEKEQYSALEKTAWKAKVPSKEDKEDFSKKNRDEMAIHLFKESSKFFKDNEWAEIFVLALYLARRRIITLRQEIPQNDGSYLCIYEHNETEEMYSITRKSLSEVDMTEVQTSLAQKLKTKAA